jgi:hypothetical protein
MLLEEMKEHYGTYAKMNAALGLAPTTYLLWKKKGGIPIDTQCLIERKTKKKFLAKEEHDWTQRR